LSTAQVFAADAKSVPKARVLFPNVNVFDGKNEKLINKAHVLVEGNLVKQVSTKKIAAHGATIIDGVVSSLSWHFTRRFGSARTPQEMRPGARWRTPRGQGAPAGRRP